MSSTTPDPNKGFRVARIAPIALGEGTQTDPALPPPSAGVWYSMNVDIHITDIRKLRYAGVVHRVGTDQVGVEGPDGGIREKERVQWRTDETMWELLNAHWDRWFPCGHSGFSNLRDEPGYTCGTSWCESRYTEREVREVLNDHGD